MIATFIDADSINFNSTDIDVVMFNGTEVWRKWEVLEYTGAVPVTITAAGEPLIDLIISGNMNQSGTPTPTTPIQPQECGERTGNLFDGVIEVGGLDTSTGEEVDNIARRRSGYIEVEANETYYFMRTMTTTSSNLWALFYDSNKDYITGSNKGTTDEGLVVSTPVNAKYVRWYVTANGSYDNLMITKGSTPPSTYIPYGYKLDISSGNTTTPVYLGEVETTRRIKKLVLTGEEASWVAATTSLFILDLPNVLTGSGIMSCMCSHYNAVTNIETNYSTLADKSCSVRYNQYKIWFRDIEVGGIDNFKTFLAQQYANGTPVTVWYVLATPTTGILNEPLRKIGNYADTLSVSQTIPTVEGENLIDVETTLKPSEVYIKYKGRQISNWHEFRRAVRNGYASTFFPVGSKLYKVWGDTTSEALIVTGYNVYFDEALTAQGYTNSVLLTEEKLTPSLQADAVEAMMYVETAMPPGTYKFTIPDYDSSYGGNKTYYFETTTTVPVGGQICLEWRYQTVPRTIRTYASSTSTTVLDSYGTSANPLPEWIDGTSPAAVDLGTASLSTSVTTGAYGTFNHIHRARYGSNNYYQSKLRQYINADVASNWWTPMTVFDRPMDFYNYGPNPASASGYLYSQPADFASVLATPTVPCYTNNTFEYGNGPDGTAFTRNTAYNVKDKLFLLSHTEVNLTSGTPAVGSVLPYYTGAADAKCIKYRKDNNSAAGWWFRVPYPSYGYNFRYCSSSGALNYYSAYNAYGLAAACVIQ